MKRKVVELVDRSYLIAKCVAKSCVHTAGESGPNLLHSPSPTFLFRFVTWFISDVVAGYSDGVLAFSTSDLSPEHLMSNVSRFLDF